MSLLLAFKNQRKLPESCKNQTILKKHIHTCFALSGIKHWSQIMKKTQKKVFSSLLNPWLPSIPKRSPLNVFSPVILLLLTLERAFLFEISKVMLVISVYWLVDQQQTTTSRRQKSDSIYLKFSVENN